MGLSEKQQAESDPSTSNKVKAATFLVTVASVSALIGFSKTVASAKREEQKLLQNSLEANKLLDGGAALARRALAWGTLYALLGTGTICLGIWKLSGANNMAEFRQKVGSRLPKISSDEPPRSRTEFEGLTDLMKYLSAWGKE